MGNRFSTIPNNNYPGSDAPADRADGNGISGGASGGAEVSRWCMQYTLGTNTTCAFELGETRIKNRVESVSVLFSDSISDNTDSAGNFAQCGVKIERARGGGLRGAIKSVNFSSGCTKKEQFCSTRTFRGCIIETHVFSYGCTFREGLLVLEKKKRLLLDRHIEGFHEVTLAHYFVAKEVGVSTLAKFHCDKGDGIEVELEQPMEHPSSDLRMVLVETCRNRAWMPTACSHCARAHNSRLSRGQHLKEFFNINRHITINCKIVAGNQYLNGLVNNAGNVQGNDNGSIHINKADIPRA